VEVITRQSLANKAAGQWAGQYGGSAAGSWHWEVGERLRALGENPDLDAVDAAIGNGSWTLVPACSECGREAEEVVELGEPPDYESSTAYVCRGCLARALGLLRETRTPNVYADYLDDRGETGAAELLRKAFPLDLDVPARSG
jgi:hypothetical protein